MWCTFADPMSAWVQKIPMPKPSQRGAMLIHALAGCIQRSAFTLGWNVLTRAKPDSAMHAPEASSPAAMAHEGRVPALNDSMIKRNTAVVLEPVILGGCQGVTRACAIVADLQRPHGAACLLGFSAG
jgi:hypothetical protein